MSNDSWQTPEWVWKPWHQVLHFVIDAAASSLNYLKPCKLYYCGQIDPDWGVDAERKFNAFKQDWRGDIEELGGGAVWCNPPYSKAAGPLLKWVEKGLYEAKKGVVVCMLLPADTSTNWFSLLWNRSSGAWKDGVQGYFTDARVRFIHPGTGKPAGSPEFGSLIVVLTKPEKN